MKFKHSTIILGKRIYLRKLLIKDANKNYLSWFSDNKSKKFIISSSSVNSIKSIKEYIRNKNNKNNVLFLGIFLKSNDKHIGNIKFEPINIKIKETTLGIMIGDKNYRNKGMGREAIDISMNWLKSNFDISNFKLGVDVKNELAIRLYEKIGFKLQSQTDLELKYLLEI